MHKRVYVRCCFRFAFFFTVQYSAEGDVAVSDECSVQYSAERGNKEGHDGSVNVRQKIVAIGDVA